MHRQCDAPRFNAFVLGSSVAAPLSPCENIGPAISSLLQAARLPMFIKRSMANYLRWFSVPPGRNDSNADLLECMHPQSVAQERELTIKLQNYRARWIAAMREQGIDFILNVPHSLPPMPRGGTGTASLLSANYCFLYNIVSDFILDIGPQADEIKLDFTAGVVPTCFVDKALDALPPHFSETQTYLHLSDAERAVFSLYDAESMHGLPLAVQVAGKRFEEEKVLEGMQILERALEASGRPFVQKEF